MSFIIEGCRIFNGNSFSSPASIAVRNGQLVSSESVQGAPVFRFDGCFLFPGFTDVHVHLREPGFSYKETIATGTRAAAHGGYTAVCAMPNLNPVPDSLPHLSEQLDLIASSACIRVHPYGAITVGEKGEILSDLEGMAPHVIAFSDDGKGVQDAGMMREAMQRAKALGKLIAAHCEDNSLLNCGYIHEGTYALQHGHRGICSASEWKPIERDLKLADETGCGYHVCHISTKESVRLIRDAKKSGVNVTCETGPHYLTLTDLDLQEDGRFKMNPPLRSPDDRDALLEGLADGTIDMIATDHAPHSAEEKSRGLEKSLMGVVGIETAFPVLHEKLVRSGILPLERLISLMTVNPARRFGLDTGLLNGAADFTVFDLNSRFAVNPASFLSLGHSTPFEGMTVSGECLMTVCGGQIVWQKNDR